MTEPTPLDKAEQAVREASVDTAAVQVALAAVELARTISAQQQAAAQSHTCDHQHKQRRSGGEWLGLACAVCVGGIGIAFASLALAILGGVAAIVVLILRDVWRDFKKGR